MDNTTTNPENTTGDVCRPAELTNREDSCHIRTVKQQRYWRAYIRYTDIIG